MDKKQIRSGLYDLKRLSPLDWRVSVCGESRTHGSEGAVRGRPLMATLQFWFREWPEFRGAVHNLGLGVVLISDGSTLSPCPSLAFSVDGINFP